MSRLLISVGKVGLLGFWLACILSLAAVIPNPYGLVILWIGGISLVAHLIEYLLVKSRMAEKNGGNTGFIQTMLFGFLHWLPVLKQLD